MYTRVKQHLNHALIIRLFFCFTKWVWSNDTGPLQRGYLRIKNVQSSKGSNVCAVGEAWSCPKPIIYSFSAKNAKGYDEQVVNCSPRCELQQPKKLLTFPKAESYLQSFWSFLLNSLEKYDTWNILGRIINVFIIGKNAKEIVIFPYNALKLKDNFYLVLL